MTGLVLILAALALMLLAVLAGRRPRPARPSPPVGPGERVIAVLRPDPDLGLSLAALGTAAGGLVLGLATLALGPASGVPLTLALGILAAPVAAEWVTALRRAWVVTDRRLIAGHGLEVALSDLTLVRILPAALEVEARGSGLPRRLRLTALADPRPAARTIQAAARALIAIEPPVPRSPGPHA
jgi:hypothetical protein